MNEKTVMRPDPKSGLEAGRDYAAVYATSHVEENDTLEYRLGYAAYLMLDQVLPSGYSMLDVGCGSGGYLRLLKNYRQIVGLDFSTEMIAVANELKARHGLSGIDYRAERFEDYRPDIAFDAVSLIGTFGWYVPWRGHEHIFAMVAGMLREGGVACFTIVPPRSVIGFLKAALFPAKTVVMRRAALSQMLTAAGFSTLLELSYQHATVVVARKNVASSNE